MPGTKLRVRGSVETTDDYSTAMGLSLEREAVKNRTGLPRWLRGKESACNVGDLGLIPGLERSLEKEKATHSSILAWRIPWAYSPWGHKESDTTEQLSLSLL